MEKWKVIANTGVYIRSAPNLASNKVDMLPSGSIIEPLERGGLRSLWLKIDKGWVCITADETHSGKRLLESMNNQYNIGTFRNNNGRAVFSLDTGGGTGGAEEDVNSGYIPAPWMYTSYSGSYGENDIVGMTNLRAIHGVPYQFLPTADIRLYNKGSTSSDSSALGSVYAEKIVSQMPILFMTPGKPNFMTRYSKTDQKNILEQIVGFVGGDKNASLDNVLTRDGRYYTFEIDHIRYFNNVNPMCRIGAQYLGLGKRQLDGVALESYNWGDGSGADSSPSYLKSKMENFFQVGLPGYTAFYLNSETQISESFSNNTTESVMAGTVSGISDYGRELNFLLGYGSAGLGIDAFKDPDVASSVENVTDFVTGILGKNNFVQSLTSNLATVAMGGQLIFPEIWSDSSLSRSYDVSLKLTTPDTDPFSWYLNIFVPLMHLVAYVAPQSINANPNGYSSPFLVRAIYKGLFNIDMGIITSMNITKGTEGAWTKEGLPTQVEVNFTIKDLYDSLTITEMKPFAKYDTMNNTALMDYIANTCGINIFKPEVIRNLEMWKVHNLDNVAGDTLFNIFGNIEKSVMNKVIQLYERTMYL